MPSTTFIPRQTLITAEWLNEVNDFVFNSEPADFLEAISLQEDPGLGGMWPDVTPETKIVRLRDRLFIGNAAASTGNLASPQGGSISTSADGANWAIINAQMLSIAQRGNMAIVGMSLSEEMGTPATAAIGVSGFCIANNAARTGFALYGDLQFESGTYGYGLELAIKNKSGIADNPHSYNANFKVCGIWMPAGGDPAYGGTANANNDVAIALGGRSTVQWNRGLVFFKDSIAGTDGVTGTGVAIELAKGHEVKWRNNSGLGFTIRSDNASGASDTYLISTDSNVTISGRLEAPILRMRHAANGVNWTRITNSSAGNLVAWETQGSDTNVGISIRVQGQASVRFNSQGTLSNDEFRIGGIFSSPVNYLHAYGTNSGQGDVRLQASGADTNLNVVLIPKGTGSFIVSGLTSRNYADDTAAAAGGVSIGGFYHNAGALRVRLV